MKSEVKTARRHDIDVLRVIGIVFIGFLFHVIQPFNPNDHWHIQNAEKSDFVGILIRFISIWRMPLIMLLAGSSAYFSLRKRSGGEFFRERVVRILIPAIIGMLIVIPPQVYFERLHNHEFSGNFLAFYPHYFEGTYPKGNFSWHHLWFLVYLFCYSVVGIFVFKLLKTGTGKKLISSLAQISKPVGGIFVFSIPLIIFQVLLQPYYPQNHGLISDWTWHSQLFTCFIMGYILVSDDRFTEVLLKRWKLHLAISIIVTVLYFSVRLIQIPMDQYSLLYVIRVSLYRLTTWAWILAFLGIGLKFLNRRFSYLKYWSEASYPIYILHQTAIVCVAYYVVQTEFPLPLKVALIFILAAVATLGGYEILRRSKTTRLVIGLKPKG